jgi:large repetitive protein
VANKPGEIGPWSCTKNEKFEQLTFDSGKKGGMARSRNRGGALFRAVGTGGTLAFVLTAAIVGPAYACGGGDPPATMTLSSSVPTGLVTGQAITFTATVSASRGPTRGLVAFAVAGSDGTAVACDDGDMQPLSTGGGGETTATCAIASGLQATVSDYTVSASLVDSHDTASPATLDQKVQKSLTDTTISGLPGSVIAGQAFSFSATVQDVSPGTGSPTGMMQFAVCPHSQKRLCTGYPSGAFPLPTPTPAEQALNENEITFSLPSGVLKPGNYDVSAIYVGDLTHRSSPSLDSALQVTKVPTTLSLEPSRNPAFDGGRLVFRSVITADPRATASLAGPSGTVTLTITGASGNTLVCHQTGTPVVPVGTRAANQGVARCSVTGQISAADSPYTITAVYSGDRVHESSTGSATVDVIPPT